MNNKKPCIKYKNNEIYENDEIQKNNEHIKNFKEFNDNLLLIVEIFIKTENTMSDTRSNIIQNLICEMLIVDYQKIEISEIDKDLRDAILFNNKQVITKMFIELLKSDDKIKDESNNNEMPYKKICELFSNEKTR